MLDGQERYESRMENKGNNTCRKMIMGNIG